MSVVPSCSGVVVPVTVWMVVMERLRGHAITALLASAALACASGRAPQLVDASALTPTLQLDLRYATANNFVGAPIDGYEAPRCLLSEPAARALGAVQAELARDRTSVWWSGTATARSAQSTTSCAGRSRRRPGAGGALLPARREA